jgi:hypothetical protein
MPVVYANIFDKRSIANEIFLLSPKMQAQPVSGKTYLYRGIGAIILQTTGRRVVFHVPMIFPKRTKAPLIRHRRDKEIALRKDQTRF